MAFVRADFHSVPVSFPLGEDGLAMVTGTTLSLRFNFREATLYVEEEVFDDLTGELSHAVGQLSRKNDVGTFWLLNPGKYRVYGVSESVLDASTELLTSRESSTVCIETPVLSKVKVEPGLDTIHELSDDTENEVELLRPVRKVDRALSPQATRREATLPVSPSRTSTPSNIVPKLAGSIVHSLMKLSARKRSKNVLSRIDFNAMKLQQVDFLPPRYNGDIIFEFPPLGVHGQNSKAKQ